MINSVLPDRPRLASGGVRLGRAVTALIAGLAAFASSLALAGPAAGAGGVAPASAARSSLTLETSRFGLPDSIAGLGDSYSSGLGAGEYYDGCDRTNRAWPMVVLGGWVTDRALLACAGARIGDVAQQVQQLAGLPRGTGRRLVTVTVGGNDVGFTDELTNCFTSPTPCTDREAVIGQRIDDLHQPLVALYRSIKRAAPGARVIVGGYPLLVRDPAVRADCPALTDLLTVAERQMLRRLATRLNDAVDAAAATAGVQSMASWVERTFNGHEACDETADSWIHGIRVTQEPDGTDTVKESFHPSSAGQSAYAKALAARWFRGWLR